VRVCVYVFMLRVLSVCLVCVVQHSTMSRDSLLYFHYSMCSPMSFCIASVLVCVLVRADYATSSQCQMILSSIFSL